MTDIENIVRECPCLHRSIRTKNGILFKKRHLSDINPALSLFAGNNNLLVLN